jgi:hypothetical protein
MPDSQASVASPPAPKPPAPPKPMPSKPSAVKRAGKPKPAAAKKGALHALPKIGQPKTPAKPKPVNVKALEPEKMTKRLAAIYKLEQECETARASFDLASQARRAARAKLDEANDALEKEIREQRYGPGPLFNATGDGPAETAKSKAVAPASGKRDSYNYDDDDGDEDDE